MRAIKHITAGLLHIEVIGQIPDRSKQQRRAARSRPTSEAMAFYNNKSSWRELELYLAANFGSQDLVITATYDDDHLPADKAAAEKIVAKFWRRLRTVRQRRGEELKYLYCTEGFHGAQADEYFGDDRLLEDCRLHHHMVINSCGPGDWEEIRTLWPGGGYIRIEPVDIHYYTELARYLTKEAREFGRPKPGARSWKGSRNLEKYTVEYIEIPSDSITLTAPYGAVDYRNFTEKNPYGFADCIGSRYLMFPNRSPEHYTYLSGKQKNKAFNNFLP